MALDSTRAIIALWRLCVPAGLGPQVGGDGAIPVDVLKVVLERELQGHLGDFGHSSVDEILQTYMQPDSEGVVGFLQFWKGMEEILRARGALRSTLSRAQEEAIIGFRFLRTCLLDMAARQVSQGRSSFSVKELRYFIGRTTALTGAEGEAFWRKQARQLPEDPEMLVTGEEVASAMLTWLEQLVDEGAWPMTDQVVSLAGRGGRRGESRAEFLRRSAKEREDRERKRVRDMAATKIQANWKRGKVREAVCREQRALFDARLEDVEQVEWRLPPDMRAPVVQKALRDYLLRPFGFFFRRGQDTNRMYRIVKLMEFTSQQPAPTNYFSGLIADEEVTRMTTLVQSWKVLRAILSMGEFVRVVKILSRIRDLLYDPATNTPWHAERSPQFFAFMLRKTDILDWALEQGSWYVNWEDIRPPVSYQMDMLRLACLGLGTMEAKTRRRLILQVLSAPILLRTLESVTSEEVLSILGHFKLGPPPNVEEDAPPLEEEADEVHDGATVRMEIFAGNAGSIFPGYLHLGEPPEEVLGWLMWLKAKLPASFFTKPGGPKQSRWRHQLWSQQLVSRLYRVARGTKLLDRVLSFYYEEPTVTYPDTMQEFTFQTDILVQIKPMTIGWSQLDAPSYRSAEAIRLLAWCIFFHEKLRSTFDVELDSPQGWWSCFDHDRIWPHLNNLLLRMFRDCPDPGPLSEQAQILRVHVSKVLSLVVQRTRRLNRKPWWLVPQLRAALQDKNFLEISANVSASLGVNESADAPCEAPQTMEAASAKLLEVALAEAPQMVPFEDRVAVMQAMIRVDKMQREDTRADWARASLRKHRIRRDYIMEDGFAAFARLNTEAELRSTFVVEFVAADGSLESGIDGGGLFKEFMILVCRAAMSPEYGLFSASSDQTLYPFPTAHMLQPNAPKLYTFLGKVIGKAIYEQMLLEHQLSRAFLNRILDKMGDAEDLASMDREAARNIAQLRQTKNIKELGLTFSTAVSMPGGAIQEADLCQRGRFRAVTQDNVDSYVQLLMDHRVTAQMALQTHFFLEGLKCVLDLKWLRMFDARELGIIISGSSAGFDVADLKHNTVYNGGFTDRSPVIQWLWDLLENGLDSEDMGSFLMFATSCSRPPLLGFKSFEPKFCIHKVDDPSRLPTASTCANLLKLPAYTSQQMLRDKLLQAIRSESGFDLS
ncbi:Ube3c [Symbiodinium sp. CCMP2592]|nr:Ube3c [Symbiodinium sp. CCMP2592]